MTPVGSWNQSQTPKAYAMYVYTVSALIHCSFDLKTGGNTCCKTVGYRFEIDHLKHFTNRKLLLCEDFFEWSPFVACGVANRFQGLLCRKTALLFARKLLLWLSFEPAHPMLLESLGCLLPQLERFKKHLLLRASRRVGRKSYEAHTKCVGTRARLGVEGHTEFVRVKFELTHKIFWARRMHSD